MYFPNLSFSATISQQKMLENVTAMFAEQCFFYATTNDIFFLNRASLFGKILVFLGKQLGQKQMYQCFCNICRYEVFSHRHWQTRILPQKRHEQSTTLTEKTSDIKSKRLGTYVSEEIILPLFLPFLQYSEEYSVK